MRRLCSSFLLVALLAAGVTAAPETGAPERKISVEIRDARLREAIRLIFQGSGLQYGVDAGVPDIPVSLNIRDIGVIPALRLLLKQASTVAPGITFSRQGGVYLIHMRRPEEGAEEPEEPPAPRSFPRDSQKAPGGNRKVTLNLHD